MKYLLFVFFVLALSDFAVSFKSWGFFSSSVERRWPTAGRGVYGNDAGKVRIEHVRIEHLSDKLEIPILTKNRLPLQQPVDELEKLKQKFYLSTFWLWKLSLFFLLWTEKSLIKKDLLNISLWRQWKKCSFDCYGNAFWKVIYFVIIHFQEVSQQKSEKMGASCCHSKVGNQPTAKVMLAAHCTYQRSITGWFRIWIFVRKYRSYRKVKDLNPKERWNIH